MLWYCLNLGNELLGDTCSQVKLQGSSQCLFFWYEIEDSFSFSKVIIIIIIKIVKNTVGNGKWSGSVHWYLPEHFASWSIIFSQSVNIFHKDYIFPLINFWQSMFTLQRVFFISWLFHSSNYNSKWHHIL